MSGLSCLSSPKGICFSPGAPCLASETWECRPISGCPIHRVAMSGLSFAVANDRPSLPHPPPEIVILSAAKDLLLSRPPNSQLPCQPPKNQKIPATPTNQARSNFKIVGILVSLNQLSLNQAAKQNCPAQRAGHSQLKVPPGIPPGLGGTDLHPERTWGTRCTRGGTLGVLWGVLFASQPL